ncbi:glycosyltransferase [Marinomonas hwangdonensis]|uniref:Glycosyltransferase n=1 Tax=Marinomonas hwangdonensis TaxID=1053647 RepID=A0A3M8PYC4_9GAMM|nr:glycosyltransferase [Marinomonas hwangdonensis]RNF48806.1 glycosyltransferase [Marinomonas hwangdonensis]
MEKNKYPKVAVLLAAYNGMQWIEEQINSILAQKNVDVTIFVSVDFSTDGTELWVETLVKNTWNVVFLTYGERFGGAGANFYRLIRDVDFKGFDYVAFSDQDDIWLDKKLDRACSLISSSVCDAYSSDVIAFWSDGRQQLIKKSYPQRKFDHFFEAAGPGCTYVFSIRSALSFQIFVRKTDNLSQLVSLHDWLAYAFCRQNGFTWFIDDQPLMLYRQHENNQVGINDGINAYKKRISLIKQRWYRSQVKTISELVNPCFSLKLNSYFFRIFSCLFFRRRLRDRLALLYIFIFGIY